MYDSIIPSGMPKNGQLYASYVDGSWPNYPQLAGLFPHKVHVAISGHYSTHAQVLDIEAGDATPAGSVSWVLAKRAQGADPTVYCNVAAWPAVKAAFAARRVPLPWWWAAQWDGKATLVADPRCVAKQYVNNPAWDASAVTTYWPGVDPKPKPRPPVPPPEESDMANPIVIYSVDKALAGAPPGTAWPGVWVLYPYAGKYAHVESSQGEVDNVKALIAGGGIDGGTITYLQHQRFLETFPTA
jgi:hypothetical protein